MARAQKGGAESPLPSANKGVLIHRLDDLHPEAQRVDDAVEGADTRRDDPVFYLGDIGFGRIGAASQFPLRYLDPLAGIQQDAAGIEGIRLLLRLDAPRRAFLAELFIQNNIVINDLMIVCLHSMPLYAYKSAKKSCNKLQLSVS